jgi:peptide/nickel transport system permease protein
MAQRTIGQRAVPVRAAESGLAQGGMARRVGRAVVLRRLLRHRGAVAGGVVLALLVLVALLAPFVAPYDPIAVSRATLKAPSAQHLMGTDNIGRDILSRVIYGTRISLWMGFIAVGIAAVFGTAIGVVAGTYGKAIDNILMRFIDALMAFPGILLALTIAAVLGPGIVNAMVAVGIASIPTFARLVRSSVLQVKQTPYIEAARAIGCAESQLIRRHILPNVLTPVLVLGTLGIAGAILVGASLSFLGLGAQPPTAEWGAMLSAGRNYITSSPQLATIPGLAILLVTIGFNLLGDGLRDALDPRLKR